MQTVDARPTANELAGVRKLLLLLSPHLLQGIHEELTEGLFSETSSGTTQGMYDQMAQFRTVVSTVSAIEHRIEL